MELRSIVISAVLVLVCGCEKKGGAATAPAAGQECADGSSCVALGDQQRAAGDFGGSTANYERACNLGSAVGCSMWGAAVVEGEGVAKDPMRGEQLMIQGCDMGDTLMCFILAHAFATDANYALSASDGTFDSLANQAANFLSKSCSGGHQCGCLAARTGECLSDPGACSLRLPDGSCHMLCVDDPACVDGAFAILPAMPSSTSPNVPAGSSTKESLQRAGG